MKNELLEKLQSGTLSEEEYTAFSRDIYTGLEVLKQENPTEYLKVIKSLTEFAKELRRVL